MRRASVSLVPLALVLLLGACASAKDYPSLARRPVERMTGSSEVVAPEATPRPLAPLSPELTTRLAQLVDQARGADQRFAARRDGATRLISAGSGAAPGSDGWSAASIALGELESARSDAMVALTELDDLYTNESIAAAETGDHGKVATIADARDQVTALVSAEDGVLAQLRGKLGS
jgi:hypothetical protein